MPIAPPTTPQWYDGAWPLRNEADAAPPQSTRAKVSRNKQSRTEPKASKQADKKGVNLVTQTCNVVPAEIKQETDERGLADFIGRIFKNYSPLFKTKPSARKMANVKW